MEGKRAEREIAQGKRDGKKGERGEGVEEEVRERLSSEREVEARVRRESAW